ncbi:hypothetical protein [Rubrobacter calidifluminis]|uniref:hypothetical protein n=1 Tax=Rubrobacter calidifluminis TaxID=1392640 RepID=UPI00236177C5|nr:hypothetical protein [Rubrobacter calidifluminis]
MTVVPTYAAIVATVAVIVTLIALYTTISSLVDVARGAPGREDHTEEADGQPTEE